MSRMHGGWQRLRVWAILLAAAGLWWPALPAPDAPGSAQRTAVVLDINGIIGPATSDYVARGLAHAAERQAALVLLRMDTPGGLDTSMRAIIRAIMASPVPVATYVTPGGARAASAGTYILYASHLAAMAPGTNLGAATPVAIGGGLPMPGRGDDPRDKPAGGGESEDKPAGGKPGDKSAGGERGDKPAGGERKADPSGQAPVGDRDTSGSGGTADPAPADKDTVRAGGRREPASASEAKAINDAVAYIRSLAELRGRNAEWAEQAVRDAASLSATAALQRNVVDIVAVNLDDLFRQAHGREVKVGDANLALDTEGLLQVAFQPDWRTEILGVITNPNIALILMMIGVYGLLFEFMSPGALYPGTIGAICLLLGLYALAALPLNFAGAGLALLGIALLVAEAFVPSFGILGIGGVIAFVFGAAILMDTEGVPGFEVYWPLIGGLALAGVGLGLLVARLAMRSLKHKVTAGREAMLGLRAEVTDWAGLSGHVFVHGERWNATASQPLQAGQRVRIVALDGLTLGVAVDDNRPTEGGTIT